MLQLTTLNLVSGVDSKNLSPVSRKSTYSKMWGVKFPGRQRRTTVSEIQTHDIDYRDRDLERQVKNGPAKILSYFVGGSISVRF